MKRYTIIERSYGDGDISMEIREDKKGQFVEYEDIYPCIEKYKDLLTRTWRELDMLDSPLADEIFDYLD